MATGRSKVQSIFKERVRKSSGEEGELTVTFMDNGVVRVETSTLDGKDHREIWLSQNSSSLLYKILAFHFDNKVLF